MRGTGQSPNKRNKGAHLNGKNKGPRLNGKNKGSRLNGKDAQRRNLPAKGSLLEKLKNPPAKGSLLEKLENPPAKNPSLEESVWTDSKSWAALRAMAPVIPLTATVITTFVYMQGYKIPAEFPKLLVNNSAVVVGFLAAVIIWLIGAHFYAPYTGASHVSRRNYSQLRQRLDGLKVRLEHACPEGHKYSKGIDGELLAVRRLACAQAEKERDRISSELQSAGMPWIRGLGYIDLWHRVHRAEEALIKVEPYSEALERARRDQARLQHSHMTNRKELLERLNEAITELENSKKAGSEETAEQQDIANTLSTLSEVHYEINHFRDDVWEGIVHARNRFSDTSMILGFAAFALLSFAIFAQADAADIRWAAFFFLTGAITGLFARAQAEWGVNTAIDDFGLSFTRMINIPWLSGLAAVGGVLLISVMGDQLLAAEQGSELKDIFDNNPSFLIAAAVFGLAPDLIVRRLMQQVESYKEDLQSTKSTQRKKSNQDSDE